MSICKISVPTVPSPMPGTVDFSYIGSSRQKKPRKMSIESGIVNWSRMVPHFQSLPQSVMLRSVV